MGRPVYPYELADPDFCWLVTNFQDRNPNYSSVETSSLPVVFIGETAEAVEQALTVVPAKADSNTKIEERN